MKAEKAIEELKRRVALIDKDYKEEAAEYLEVLQTAVESLEKHTPKKPIFQHRESVVHYDYADGHGESKVERYADWTCPVCGWFVGEQYVPRKHNQQKSSFCSRCGQAIDWDMKPTE